MTFRSASVRYATATNSGIIMSRIFRIIQIKGNRFCSVIDAPSKAQSLQTPPQIQLLPSIPQATKLDLRLGYRLFQNKKPSRTPLVSRVHYRQTSNSIAQPPLNLHTLYLVL